MGNDENHKIPTIKDDVPLAIAAKDSEPQPSHWPKVNKPTHPADIATNSGNGLPMRESSLNQGIARYKYEADLATAE